MTNIPSPVRKILPNLANDRSTQILKEIYTKFVSYKKGKAVPVHAMKVYIKNRGTAPLILNFSTT
jgi:hypothetical protein